ncbi:MAG: efflux RND transporter periplasmic adaptor subunit, partial [Duodenibacillus sp.]|nr:efflux RND transporter periplasmic adaptor subunit [Duodenibacillus sp.]
ASGEEYPIKGKLSMQDAVVDTQMGTVRIRAVFDNPDRILLPGMYVRARFTDGVQDNVVKVEQRAVMRAQNGAPYCYVVDDHNRVARRDIRIDGSEGNYWIVAEGLGDGDKVIVNGIQQVLPGAAVIYQKPGKAK